MTIKEYRETENNKSGGTDLFMSEYPLYCQYMLDIHERYGHLDYHGPNPVCYYIRLSIQSIGILNTTLMKILKYIMIDCKNLGLIQIIV